MKKLRYITLSFAAACLLASCGEKEESRTWVTAYPVLTMEGESVYYMDKNEDFTDPGCVAILDGEDVSDQISVQSNLDLSKSGKYTINYTIVNADGFSASASRTIYVFDPADSFTGIYEVKPGSHRISGGARSDYSGFPVLIYGNASDGYTVTDLLGGFYEYLRGYGPAYAMTGMVSLGSDGNLNLIGSFIQGWGDGLSSLEGKFSGSEVTWKAIYVGMEFNIILQK